MPVRIIPTHSACLQYTTERPSWIISWEEKAQVMDFWVSKEKVWIVSESVSSPRGGPSHVAPLDNSQGQDCVSFEFPVLDPKSPEKQAGNVCT